MDTTTSDEQRRGDLSRRRFFNSVAAGAAVTAATPAGAQTGAQELADPAMVKAVLNVNGQTHTVLVEPRSTLSQVLREALELTGTKPGCERGECGACTVLIDGVARASCMTLALEAEGCEITTIEGLMRGDQLGQVQQAFLEEDAYQCGYCTPGQVMSVEGLLRKNPEPSLDEIREGVSGNLCRCGTYAHIFRAAQRAAESRKVGS